MMYCLHKLGEGHMQWQEKKYIQCGKKTRSPTPTSKIYADTMKTGGDKKKLVLSQALQAALMTHTGISEDHFQKIWETSLQ